MDKREDFDTELIERARSGESTALEEMIRLLSPRIYAIAYQTIGNYPDAQDITQDVFCRLIAHAGSEEKIYILTYLMPDSTKAERHMIRNALLEKYDPYFNNGV